MPAKEERSLTQRNQRGAEAAEDRRRPGRVNHGDTESTEGARREAGVERVEAAIRHPDRGVRRAEGSLFDRARVGGSAPLALLAGASTRYVVPPSGGLFFALLHFDIRYSVFAIRHSRLFAADCKTP